MTTVPLRAIGKPGSKPTFKSISDTCGEKRVVVRSRTAAAILVGHVGGDSVRSRSGTSSRKGYLVNGHISNNKTHSTNNYAPPLPLPPLRFHQSGVHVLGGHRRARSPAGPPHHPLLAPRLSTPSLPPVLTSVASLMVCLTLPISPFDVAARCIENRVSACPFSSPNTSPRAMKKGEQRNGCVSV